MKHDQRADKVAAVINKQKSGDGAQVKTKSVIKQAAAIE